MVVSKSCAETTSTKYLFFDIFLEIPEFRTTSFCFPLGINYSTMVAEAANKNTGDCLEVRFPGQQEAGGKAVKAPKSMGKTEPLVGFAFFHHGN